MSTEQNKAIIRRFWEAADRKDFEACAQMLHPQSVAHGPGPGMEHLDAQAYRQLGEGFYAAFPDIKHTIEDQIAEGDKVVTRMTLRGTHQGELRDPGGGLSIPPTGKAVTMGAIAFDRIANGKVLEHRWVDDLMGLMQQLGVIPSPE